MVSALDKSKAKSGRIKDLRTLINKLFKTTGEDRAEYRDLVLESAQTVILHNNAAKSNRYICSAGHAHRSSEAKEKCEKIKGVEKREFTTRNDDIYRAIEVEGDSLRVVAEKYGISHTRTVQIVNKGRRITRHPSYPAGDTSPYKFNRGRSTRDTRG